MSGSFSGGTISLAVNPLESERSLHSPLRLSLPIACLAISNARLSATSIAYPANSRECESLPNSLRARSRNSETARAARTAHRSGRFLNGLSGPAVFRPSFKEQPMLSSNVRRGVSSEWPESVEQCLACCVRCAPIGPDGAQENL
eukprot:scaffold72502_cov31-Tisochrysis_lutea.AAC.4